MNDPMVQRIAQHAARLVILVAFLAVLGLAGALETAAP